MCINTSAWERQRENFKVSMNESLLEEYIHIVFVPIKG